jgi:hypothetical protein
MVKAQNLLEVFFATYCSQAVLTEFYQYLKKRDAPRIELGT